MWHILNWTYPSRSRIPSDADKDNGIADVSNKRRHAKAKTPGYYLRPVPKTPIRSGWYGRLGNKKVLSLQNPTDVAQKKGYRRLGERLLNCVVNYLILRAAHPFRNLLTWQRLGAIVVFLYVVVFSRANAQTTAPTSSVPAQTDKQSNKQGVTSGGGTGKLLSFTFTVDSGKLTPTQCDAQTLPDSTNLCLMGYFSPAGKVSDLNIPWFAMLDEQGKIPAFASQTKNPTGNPSRGRVFPLPDGSGYYLAISDIQRSGKFGSAGEKRLGLIRVDKSGNLIWAKLYHFRGASGLPLIRKVAIDGSMLAIPVVGSPSPTLVARIAPDGRKLWAKNTDAPNLAFDDFHCDGTPYRFIKPRLLSVGLTVASTKLPTTVILAQDYETGKILYQTRYPGDFTGGAGICPATGDSIYISTLGIQMSMRTNASIARFDQQLRLITAKEIIGAESSFPILCQRASNQNLLSYYFHKRQRGEAAALDDNLQPIDTSCPWIKDLRLAMAQSSYTATDADSSEENLEVTSAPGESQIQPSELKLEPLNLNVSLEGAQKRSER
jgi:hypothetical protein